MSFGVQCDSGSLSFHPIGWQLEKVWRYFISELRHRLRYWQYLGTGEGGNKCRRGVNRCHQKCPHGVTPQKIDSMRSTIADYMPTIGIGDDCPASAKIRGTSLRVWSDAVKQEGISPCAGITSWPTSSGASSWPTQCPISSMESRAMPFKVPLHHRPAKACPPRRSTS